MEDSNIIIADGAINWAIKDLRKEGIASSSNDGLMSKKDKIKLDLLSLEAEANKIDSISVDGVAQLIDSSKNVNLVLSKYAKKSDINDIVTSIPFATETTGGLMSNLDKKKLNELAAGGGTNNIEAVSVNGVDQPINNKKVTIYIHNADTSNNGLMSSTDKKKLNELISTGGEANKIDTIKVNGTTMVPDSNKTVNISLDNVLEEYVKLEDLNELTGGNVNIIERLQVDGEDQTVIASTKTVNLKLSEKFVDKNSLLSSIPNATNTTSGLMSSEDKSRLDGLVSTGGEANIIDTIKVNGTALTPDSNKAVNIDLSNYATKSELSSAGEANIIEKVAVNNNDLSITNKRVNIDLSEYAKTRDVSLAIGNIPIATSNTKGLMSSFDKSRLDELTAATSAGEVNKINSISLNGTPIAPDGNKRVNIPQFSSTSDGIVPKSGGGTTKYLRADMTWQVPPGSTYSVATTSALGLVKIGNNISVSNDGTISVPNASTTTFGAVKIGNNISANSGIISVPTASTTTLGVVKIGANINVSGGTISVPNASSTSDGIVPKSGGGTTKYLRADMTWQVPPNNTYSAATTSALGLVKIGANITVNSGTISVPTASTSALGVVKIGSNISVNSGTISLTSANVTTALGYTPVNPAQATFKKIVIEDKDATVNSVGSGGIFATRGTIANNANIPILTFYLMPGDSAGGQHGYGYQTVLNSTHGMVLLAGENLYKQYLKDLVPTGGESIKLVTDNSVIIQTAGTADNVADITDLSKLKTWTFHRNGNLTAPGNIYASSITTTGNINSSGTVKGSQVIGLGAVFWGTSSTASGTAAKVVICSNFTLVAGAQVVFFLQNNNTASNPTINVNNTGAKAIYSNNVRLTTGEFKRGYYHVVYHNDAYRVISSNTY